MAFQEKRENDTNVERPRHTWTKLKSSKTYVMAPGAASKTVFESYGPDLRKPPIYLPTGNEVKVLKDLVRESIPVVLSGPPGVGKTTLIRHVFHELGIPLQTFLCSAATQIHELLGRQTTSGDAGDLPVWADGALSLAARAAAGGLTNGIYLDEVIRLPEALASALYSITDSRHTLYLPTGEEIKVGNDLKTVFSYNPSKDVRLDHAFRSRLTAIRFSYAPMEVESKVLLEPEIGKLDSIEEGLRVARGLVRLANIIRASHGYECEADIHKPSESEIKLLRLLPAPPSTRMLVVAARMIVKGDYTPREAVEFFILPSILQDLQDYELPALRKLLNTIVAEVIPDMESTHAKYEKMMKTEQTKHRPATTFHEEPTERKRDPRNETKADEISSRIARDWETRGGY